MTTEWFNIVQKKLEAWWLYAVEMLPNFTLAVVVILLFYFVARFVRHLSGRFVLRVSKSASLSGLLSGVIYIFILAAGMMSALDILQLHKAVSSLLAGVGIIGLALGFAFQDLTANFISGAFIAIRRPFDVGHIVETNGFLGTIEQIELRSTTLRTSAGLHVIIPNKDIFQKPIINYSRTEERKVEFEFVIPNTIDTTFTAKILRHAMARLGNRSSVNRLEFFYTAIESPNMRLNVSFWTRHTDPEEYMRIRHKAIMAIHQSFVHNRIYRVTIPDEAKLEEQRQKVAIQNQKNPPKQNPPRQNPPDRTDKPES